MKTILKLSNSEGANGRGVGGHAFNFGGPDYKFVMLTHTHIYIHTHTHTLLYIIHTNTHIFFFDQVEIRLT